jgi:hypothetical protein
VGAIAGVTMLLSGWRWVVEVERSDGCCERQGPAVTVPSFCCWWCWTGHCCVCLQPLLQRALASAHPPAAASTCAITQ